MWKINRANNGQSRMPAAGAELGPFIKPGHKFVNVTTVNVNIDENIANRIKWRTNRASSVRNLINL